MLWLMGGRMGSLYCCVGDNMVLKGVRERRRCLALREDDLWLRAWKEQQKCFNDEGVTGSLQR